MKILVTELDIRKAFEKIGLTNETLGSKLSDVFYGDFAKCTIKDFEYDDKNLYVIFDIKLSEDLSSAEIKEYFDEGFEDTLRSFNIYPYNIEYSLKRDNSLIVDVTLTNSEVLALLEHSGMLDTISGIVFE